MMQALTEQTHPSWTDNQSLPHEFAGNLLAVGWDDHFTSRYHDISSHETIGGVTDIYELLPDKLSNRIALQPDIWNVGSVDIENVVKSLFVQTSSWRSEAAALENGRFSSIRKREIDGLLKAYVFEEDLIVREFLAVHRSVPQLLLEAVPVLKNFFGEIAVLNLRVISDESGVGTIYGIVSWQDTAEAARSALRKFDESWWIAASEKASGRVMFDYLLA
jgi:hypothetical protein